MEANRKRQLYQTNTNYIDGNTARKQAYIGQNAMQNYSAVPERRRELPAPRRPVPTPERQIHRQPRHLSGISKASLFILTIAIAATLYFCIEFLWLQHQVGNMEKNILTMEQDLNAKRSENDAAYEQINMVYDLDYVYSIAISELGMVYPNNNEVITFESTDDSYVRQYADIPK
ncbi:MAG: septum formation initiator family protein [Herbinix sp.]|nr:septum formation initiator family protein [Herbinix sp.]